MAKAILEFDLSDLDDQQDWRTFNQAVDLRRAIQEFDEWLRKQHKYDAGEVEAGPAWDVRQKLGEILSEFEVDID